MARPASESLAYSERPETYVPDRVQTDRSFSSCFCGLLISVVPALRGPVIYRLDAEDLLRPSPRFWDSSGMTPLRSRPRLDDRIRIRSAAGRASLSTSDKTSVRCPTRVCSRRGPRCARTTQLKPATLDSAAYNGSRAVKTATERGSGIRDSDRVRQRSSGRRRARVRRAACSAAPSEIDTSARAFPGWALAFSEQPDTAFRSESRLEALLLSCSLGRSFAVPLASIHRALPSFLRDSAGFRASA
jgi:hypothetical protein